jgi:hypothetical protein
MEGPTVASLCDAMVGNLRVNHVPVYPEELLSVGATRIMGKRQPTRNPI